MSHFSVNRSTTLQNKEKMTEKADPRRFQSIDSVQLNPPILSDIRAVLENGLKQNYQFVTVSFGHGKSRMVFSIFRWFFEKFAFMPEG